MIFKEYNTTQSFLLPPSFEEFLGESHQAIILNEFINEIDIKFLEKSYKNTKGGASAYHPVMLLKTLIYAYMNGLFSSRKIGKKLREDIAYMFLAGNNQPDFRTINRFRREKGKYLEKIFIQVVQKASEIGLVQFNICSLDGSKFYANASRANNKNELSLELEIQNLLKEADKIDELEDKEYGDNEDDLDPQLRTSDGRRKRKKEILKEKLKKQLQKENIKNITNNSSEKLNTTDPDSKLMQMKKKDFANGYNIQNITENGIILTSSISNNSADAHSFIETVEKLIQLHQTPKKILADKGYSSEKNYEYCEKKKIDAYIPTHTEAIDISQYLYDSQKDTYINKKGESFFFKQYMNPKNKNLKRGRPRKDKDLKNKESLYRTKLYEYKDNNSKIKKYLSISPGWQKFAQEQKSKLKTKQGKWIYKHRMHDVEGVFANIKKNLGFNTFSLRGMSNVFYEWILVCLAHNIKKII